MSTSANSSASCMSMWWRIWFVLATPSSVRSGSVNASSMSGAAPGVLHEVHEDRAGVLRIGRIGVGIQHRGADGDEVREGERGAGLRHAARVDEHCCGIVQGGRDLGIAGRHAQVVDDRDSQPRRQRLRDLLLVGDGGWRQRVRIALVDADHDVEVASAVAHRPSERPVVDHVRVAQVAGAARHAPIRALHADDAAPACRQSNRAAHVRAGRERHEASRERRARATRRAARCLREVPRVVRRAVQHGGRVEEPTHLGRCGLADGHRAGAEQARRHRRGGRRDTVLVRGRRTRLGPALDRFELLDAERHAAERTWIIARGDPTIDFGRRGHRAIGIEVYERIERRVEPVDALEVVLEDLDGLQLRPAHPGRDRRRVELV